MNEQLPLYQERIPVYPRSVKGRFRRLKWAVLILAYGVYFALPWLSWSRPSGSDQAVMFDIQDRIFYLFGMIVNPQDIFWLATFLVIAAFLLFFVTGLAGRVFCGYFCFQTLWTDLYILIEKWVQGERPARIRLDKSAWNGEKLLKKLFTHLLWLLVAFVTGLTFTLYWGESDELVREFFTLQAPFPAYATTLFLTMTTYVMAGLAREQVCTYMCPYARFQSIMFDSDTRIVAYDETRGEGGHGRAKLQAGLKQQDERHQQGHGDCIDCGFCVQVCPTGIDIRDGLQMSCIHCALCIDACDNIMDNLGWSRGLIRYASENELEGKKSRLFKLKNISYALALLAASAALVWSIATKESLSVSVTQVRNPMYVRLSDGRLQNSYELGVTNKSEHPMALRIRLRGLEQAELDLGRLHDLELEPLSSLNLYVKIRMQPEQGHGVQLPFEFVIDAQYNDQSATHAKQALFTLPGGAP